jgi:hypothetical protein
LPVTKNTVDKSKALIMEEFDASSQNTHAEGGRSRGGHGDEDDDEDGMPRGQGQRVQCAQQ